VPFPCDIWTQVKMMTLLRVSCADGSYLQQWYQHGCLLVVLAMGCGTWQRQCMLHCGLIIQMHLRRTFSRSDCRLIYPHISLATYLTQYQPVLWTFGFVFVTMISVHFSFHTLLICLTLGMCFVTFYHSYCLRPKRHKLTLAIRRDSQNFFFCLKTCISIFFTYFSNFHRMYLSYHIICCVLPTS